MRNSKLPLIGILTGIAVVGAVALRQDGHGAGCCRLCQCGQGTSVMACDNGHCAPGVICGMCDGPNGSVVPCQTTQSTGGNLGVQG